MDSGMLYALFGWGSPIGTGLFLVMLGIFIYLLAQVGKRDQKKK